MVAEDPRNPSGALRPPSKPGTGPAWPTQASAPNTAHAAGPGAPGTDARARPISGRLRSAGRRRGQSARRWKGRGGSWGGSREAEPPAALLPGAVGPSPEAACGEAPARGLKLGPGPTSQRPPPPSAAAPQSLCSLHASPRGDTETEKGTLGESCSRPYPLLPLLRLTFKPRQNGAAAKVAATAHVQARPRLGAGPGMLWVPPWLEGPIGTPLWSAVTSQETMPFDAGCWFGFLCADRGRCSKWLLVAFNSWMDYARPRQRRERPSILGQAE